MALSRVQVLSGSRRINSGKNLRFQGESLKVSTSGELKAALRLKKGSFRGGQCNVSTRATNKDEAAGEPEASSSNELDPSPQSLLESDAENDASSRGKLKLSKKGNEQQNFTLDDVADPVGLGRKSRQLFDDVWKRLIQLGQLTQATLEDDYELVQGPACEFTIPNAEFTTVLVVGATGRVGRVLIRKLLLRGYKVKALIRNNDPETIEKLPRAVELVVGDVGDPRTLRAAVEGSNKIVYCARARTTIASDLLRVEQQGVDNLARAFLDYNHILATRRSGRSPKCKIAIGRFKRPEQQEGWELREGTVQMGDMDYVYDAGMDADLEFTEKGTGLFKGYVYTRNSYVELARNITLPDGMGLDRFEGILMSAIGDGKSYQMVLETDVDDNGESMQYGAKFPTKLGHSRIRIPFGAFRPLRDGDPPMDLKQIKGLCIRFDHKKIRSTPTRANMRAVDRSPTGENTFRLEIGFIKVLPGGEETDFILVSCAGAGVALESREKVLKAKSIGETILKNSGLGYTIVRPGALLEEPGGQRALVFDQGNRITQGISCADVADVCVKALHDPTARNKSFDVCYEYTDGQGLYELVAHLPDKSNNYLTPALQLLEKNT